MNRWICIVATVLPLAALAAPGLDALCEGDRTADVVVGADEFAIIGFDAESGALSILPPRTLLTTGHGSCRLRLKTEHLLLPVAGDAVKLILEAWNTSALELMIRVKRLDRDQPPEKVACQNLHPEYVELRVGELKVAERDLTRPLPTRARRPIHVGVVLAEPGTPPFVHYRLRDTVQFLSQVCLRRQGDAAFNVRGSISVQLRKARDGRPSRPTLAVDGLVNEPLTQCLLREMKDDPNVWKDLPAGALVYVPVFFRSGPPAPAARVRDPKYIKAVWSGE